MQQYYCTVMRMLLRMLERSNLSALNNLYVDIFRYLSCKVQIAKVWTTPNNLNIFLKSMLPDDLKCWISSCRMVQAHELTKNLESHLLREKKATDKEPIIIQLIFMKFSIFLKIFRRWLISLSELHGIFYTLSMMHKVLWYGCVE